MQLFASRALVALVALLGASMASAVTTADQSYSKPMVVRSGGLTTVTLDVTFTDLTFTRRLLAEERELATKPKYVEIEAFFFNNGGNRIASLSVNGTKNSTKSDKAGHSAKSTDDVQLRSAKLFPNFKPKVEANTTTVGTGDNALTLVKWSLPTDEIEENKKYSFTLKLKLGPNTKSGEIFGVLFTSLTTGVDIGDLAPIVVK